VSVSGKAQAGLWTAPVSVRPGPLHAQAALHDAHGFIIQLCGCGGGKFLEKRNNKLFNCFCLDEGNKDWSDKGNHHSAGVGVLPSASHSRYF